MIEVNYNFQNLKFPQRPNKKINGYPPCMFAGNKINEYRTSGSITAVYAAIKNCLIHLRHAYKNTKAQYTGTGTSTNF
jgi:hypothetical protein